MADAKSNTAENMVVTWLYTTDAVTRPTAWYLALFTSDPTDAGSGTELSGGSYSRKSVTFTVSGNTASNVADAVYSLLPAAVVTHVGVYTASTGGTLLHYGELTSARTVEENDGLTIAAGELDISEL